MVICSWIKASLTSTAMHKWACETNSIMFLTRQLLWKNETWMRHTVWTYHLGAIHRNGHYKTQGTKTYHNSKIIHTIKRTSQGWILSVSGSLHTDAVFTHADTPNKLFFFSRWWGLNGKDKYVKKQQTAFSWASWFHRSTAWILSTSK